MMSSPSLSSRLPHRLAIAACCLFLCPASGFAEDAPADQEFPAAPPPATSAADDAWSTPSGPSAAPRAASASSTLPPPRVVRRRSSSAPAAGEPVQPAALPIRSVPDQRRPAQAPLPQPTQPRPMQAQPMQAQPMHPVPMQGGASLPGASTRMTAVQTGARILDIRKTHNVKGAEQEKGGPLYLQLDVDYEVSDQQGYDIYVGVWFLQASDRKPIQSLSNQYRDASGTAMVQTRWTRVASPRATYTATLQIPYATFPAQASGTSYGVEARVQVLRIETQRRMVRVLASDMTTFQVYGLPADGTRAKRRTGTELDTRGFEMPGLGEIDQPGEPTGFGAADVAGESGRIETPGIQDGSGAQAKLGESGVIDDLPDLPDPVPPGK
jgi:hypothetical protein